MDPLKVTHRRFVPERAAASGFQPPTGTDLRRSHMPDIAESKILIIATDGYEDSELLEPRKRLLAAGAEVVLASPETKEIKGDKGASIRPDIAVDDVDAEDFDALLLPGGVANP